MTDTELTALISRRKRRVQMSENSLKEQIEENTTVKGRYESLAYHHQKLGTYYILDSSYDLATESFGEAARYYVKRAENVMANEEEMDRQAVWDVPIVLGAACWRAVLTTDSETISSVAEATLAMDESYRQKGKHPQLYHLTRCQAALLLEKEPLAAEEFQHYLDAGQAPGDTPELYECLIERNPDLARAALDKVFHDHRDGLDDPANPDPDEQISLNATELIVAGRRRGMDLKADYEFVPTDFVNFLHPR